MCRCKSCHSPPKSFAKMPFTSHEFLQGGHGLRQAVVCVCGGGGWSSTGPRRCSRAGRPRAPRGRAFVSLAFEFPPFFSVVAPCSCVLGYMGALWAMGSGGVSKWEGGPGAARCQEQDCPKHRNRCVIKFGLFSQLSRSQKIFDVPGAPPRPPESRAPPRPPATRGPTGCRRGP